VVETPDHAKILGSGQVLVDRCVLPRETNASSHRVGLLDDVKSVDGGGAGSGKQNRREDPHHRRLARPIGTEQPKHLSLRHVKAHVVEGANLTLVETSFDIERLNCEIRHGGSLDTCAVTRFSRGTKRVPSTYGYIGQ
jgi:hypothetical protein